MKFPNYIQADAKDCGPSCLKIISKFYGKSVSIEDLRKLSENTREGSSLKSLSIAAEKMGFIGREEGIAVQSIATVKYYNWKNK